MKKDNETEVRLVNDNNNVDHFKLMITNLDTKIIYLKDAHTKAKKLIDQALVKNSNSSSLSGFAGASTNTLCCWSRCQQ